MSTNVPSCDGCVHERKHAMAFPCRDCDTFDHYTDGASPLPPTDLEVWRQAYNAAITSDCDPTAVRDWGNVADRALADYRAKREELLQNA